MKFKLKAYTADYIEVEVEASNLEQAQDKVIAMCDNGEIQSEEGFIFFEKEEGFEVLKDLLNIDDLEEIDSEELEKACEEGEDCEDGCECGK